MNEKRMDRKFHREFKAELDREERRSSYGEKNRLLLRLVSITPSVFFCFLLCLFIPKQHLNVAAKPGPFSSLNLSEGQDLDFDKMEITYHPDTDYITGVRDARIHMNANASGKIILLHSLFDSIERATGLYIHYDPELVKDTDLCIHYLILNLPAITKMLKNLYLIRRYKYSQVGKTIWIRKKKGSSYAMVLYEL